MPAVSQGFQDKASSGRAGDGAGQEQRLVAPEEGGAELSWAQQQQQQRSLSPMHVSHDGGALDGINPQVNVFDFVSSLVGLIEGKFSDASCARVRFTSVRLFLTFHWVLVINHSSSMKLVWGATRLHSCRRKRQYRVL